MTRIGITGAHKSGKTTLAKAVAKKWGIPFVETSLSDVLRAYGVTPNEELPFARRLEVQQGMIGHLINVLTDAGDDFISDRTFMDIAAMTLSFMPHGVSSLESETVRMIVDQCYRAQESFFDKTIIVTNSFEPPVTEDEAEKGAYCWAWNFQISAIVKGLALNPMNRCNTSFLPETASSLPRRMEHMERMVSEMQQEAAELIH